MTEEFRRWYMKKKTFEDFNLFKREFENELMIVLEDGIIEYTQDGFASLIIECKVQILPILVDLVLSRIKSDKFS